MYVARVSGVFPLEPLVVETALSWDPQAGQAAVPPAVRPAAHADGGMTPPAAAAAPAGKPSVTCFQRLAVAADGRTSLVECR